MLNYLLVAAGLASGNILYGVAMTAPPERISERIFFQSITVLVCWIIFGRK
jgi:hypothetical protein